MSIGSTEKIVDRDKFELFQEKTFIQPKKTLNNCLVNQVNYSILSPNR